MQAGVCAILFLIALTEGSLWGCVIMGVFAILASLLFRQATIIVDEWSISGPARWFPSRVRIPLDDIDLERTRRRPLLDKVFFGWTIWAKDGSRIYIQTNAYGGHALTSDILRTVGVMTLDSSTSKMTQRSNPGRRA